MISRSDIKDISLVELTERLKCSGLESYRARQIFNWLYSKTVRSFEEMTDLPEDLRAFLKKHFHIIRFSVLDQRRSTLDGTSKYLFKLEDANTIEAVFLPEGERNTICLSSQVGCKYGCKFCASAPFGFIRNLTSSEIIEEVLAVKSLHPGARITNLVFMGIGEPMDNYDNVLKAVRIFNSKDAFNIGARRITLSTCGIVPGIEALEKEALQIELSVSLHSAKDAVRSALVPINKKYPIKDLIAACRHYTETTGRVITFEYVLLEGINSSEDDAVALAKLLKRMMCKVNIISYNDIRAKGYSESSPGAFIRVLRDNGLNVTRRKSKGADIDAGCGQLRISRL